METDDEHVKGMARLHRDCTFVKYHYWKVLGMKRPVPETIFTECRDK